jgi:hypothetical protein
VSSPVKVAFEALDGVLPIIKPLPLPLVWHSFRNAPNARKFQSHVNSGAICRNSNFV